MADKKSWDQLTHPQRIEILKQSNDDEITDTYLPPAGMSANQFMEHLADLRDVWQPDTLGNFKTAGGPPNKETIMGAWRDLNRSEALLELIDNSIDAWMRRRKKYAKHTAKTLQIYVDIHPASNKLFYEDNSGGVREGELANLVIPGFSTTGDTEATIGSYRTGGKKAIFKLASEANIRSYYFDPDAILDDAFGVHLDKGWLQDPDEYKFVYYPITSRSDILKGHTIYTFRLRDTGWDENVFDQVLTEIRRTYTLLLVRNPNIEIYFNDRSNPLTPLSELYRFSGASNRKVDVRPQRVTFGCSLKWKDAPYDVEIEIVLGCRTTTAGQKGEDKWGIDIYGNDRLFVHHNQDETFKWFDLPPGNSRTLVRGFINIHGPNVFMPWDTHKRHLNIDREIIDVLRSKPIRDLFAAWKEAYNAISGMEEIKATIKQGFEPWKDGKDIHVEFSNDVPLMAGRRRGVSLPESVHRPKVTPRQAAAGKTQVAISFKVTQAEFRRLCSKHEIDTSAGEQQARKQLAEAIKTLALSLR